MLPLTAERVEALLAPYLSGSPTPADLYGKVAVYIALLMRWNARTNLTAIRDGEHLVQRQVGESLFASRFLQGSEHVLDFGSGAGFPGIPLQLMNPAAKVLLAESQGKKASFLREAVRVLELSCEVWAGRVEALPCERTFDVVTMRAVDQPHAMDLVAVSRLQEGGRLLRYASAQEMFGLEGFTLEQDVQMPLTQGRLLCARRVSSVPRGTSV